MRHAQEICAGKAASPDDQKFSAGTMQCRKSVSNKSHFRTIAPKLVPKVVSSCSASCYPPSLPDVAVSGINTKPLIMPTQNYALMKVAGHEGTFSLVTLSQVNPPVVTPVNQSSSKPLQENTKLPIPRYQSTKNKRLFDKTAKLNSLNVTHKIKSEKPVTHTTSDSQSENIPKLDSTEKVNLSCHSRVKSADEAIVVKTAASPGSCAGNGVENIKVKSPVLQYVEDGQHKALCARGSPAKPNEEAEKSNCSAESRAQRENTKGVDSSNSLTVVFGSPGHLIPSLPKGKLSISPYSKIRKSVISESEQSLSVAPVKANSSDIPTVGSGQVCVLDNPQRSEVKPDSNNIDKHNSLLAKRRGRKRKNPNESAALRAKMKVVGNKLLMCKDKVKMQVLNTDKKIVSIKKYRSIMPKPFMNLQGLASIASGMPIVQTQTTESACRKLQMRPNRWKPFEGMSVKQSVDNKCMSSVIKPFHKCHICDHKFQFKHHLQDHLNSHTNRRPYHCRLCRKAYVHSGSLSTHMKLHHSESRLKKLMCCEFCAKVFGHIRVYFGHLKEVHRVIISTETTTIQVEKQDTTTKIKEEKTSIGRRENNSNNEDNSIYEQMDEIKLQIKCGRCQAITPTFSDMKLHLFCEHGEEFQDRLQEGILEIRRGTQEEVVKHATHYWKLLSERQNITCSSCDEKFLGSSKLRKHTCTAHQDHNKLQGSDFTQTEFVGEDTKQKDNLSVTNPEVQLCCGSHLNCILCKQEFKLKEELLSHWCHFHNCENPSLLWTVFNSFVKNDKSY
ncbi:zinc finger protein 438 [Bombina bombina]|uniref:zinc finger protein 438 n=1 Tax=Bombina bombina TaxID=8345 RepID=UPI00235A53B3|nr:zinc finger protein 438 [Bombina bombina]XP_053569850.1 zinc finger protein 438 [Bombina bombina]XP_053569851.1 zinc finger protein 438 [Bombina bombina]